MDQHNSLFGTLVKDITSLVIPIPLSTTIEALPILQRSSLYISDRVFGDTNIRMVRLVFLGNGRVYIQGSEWNSFVRDRGIRVGDVLLLKLVHQVSQLINMIINVTLIRLNRQNNHTFTPPLPQNQEQEQDRNWEQPFLCVKRLSDIDVCKVVEHGPQILMPKEIWEVITESSLVVDFHLNDMLQGNFEVNLRDQTIEILELVVYLGIRVDSEVMFRYENWMDFVDRRCLNDEDVIVFCVDLPRRTITTTVYRSHQQTDFFIPMPQEEIELSNISDM
ncbi:hypothetical protein CsatA_008929 [Cannabis sativa]